MTSANSKTGSHTAHIKSSYLNTREYDEPHMHKRFTAICDAMHSRTEKELGFEPSHVTARSLSLQTGHLRAFVESALGKNSNPATRNITKFPHRLFSDYRPDGALYNMLCVCLNFKYLHGLRRIEFSNMDKRGFNFDLLGRIEKSLKQARLLPMVRIYFARALPPAVQPSLRAIVQKRGAIVSSASAATHIVYPDPSGTTVAETAGTDYCRPLKLKEGVALVHWWYYPDSYDSWIPRADVDGEPDPPEDNKGPWHVQMRWLEDTELYNEWMNPADYEIPVESRMTVILAPRAEDASPVADSERSIVEPEKQENTAKISKKRRRVSSTKPQVSSQVASKSYEKSKELDEMHLGDSSSGSEDKEMIRLSHKNADTASKERHNKDMSDASKKNNDAEVLHQRKRARISEEGKKGSHKHSSQQSVKVRLSLKAPKEKSKSRSKEKVKDEKKRDEPKHQRREASADSRGGAGLKVRVKLGRPISASLKEAIKAETKVRDSDNDDAMSTQATPVATTALHQIEYGEKREPERKDKVTAKSEKDSTTRTTHRIASKITDKSDPDNDVQNGDAVQEQKRPFSRRKSRKKERNMDIKIPGVTVVDDAVPLPEGEVPRIRNISNEGAGIVPAKDRASAPGNFETSDSMDVENVLDGRIDKEKERTRGMNGETPMGFDSKPGSRRVMAVSEKMLDGDEANAPVSGADLVAAVPQSTIRMPAHSRWFRMDAIHDIEKRSLSEFFNNRSESKTPMVYKKYRDFMIDVWRQAPDKYLTATSVRRHLAGDVCAILRVHAFLEHWGFINYGTEPESKPHLGSSLRARYSRPRAVLVDGHVREHASGVPRLLFFDEPRPQKREGAPVSLQKAVKAAKEKNGQQRTSSLLSRRELYATAAATKYECDGCGSDCSRMRYHCVGSADIELCPSCFANGMYPETLSARDFEQLTTVLGSEGHDGSVWSEAEVLLLLEGLEKFGDDWNQVSEHVGSKTNEQCVLQFLRMPIEDSFLGDQLGKWDVGQGGTQNTDITQEGKCDGNRNFAGPLLPFADTANPVMAQVAFLASSVSPEVAAAAAQAALHSLMSKSGAQSTITNTGQRAQAKALLNPSAIKNDPTENGIADGSSRPGSKLGSLPGTKLDAVAVEAAAAVGLAAAVAKAKTLADAEGREIERAFAVAVETKLRVVDMKLQEFDRLEQHMRRERDRLEKQRQNVYADRVEAALMRTGGQVQASRVAAAHEAAANVAAGMPVPRIYTGSTARLPGGGVMMGGPPHVGTGQAASALVNRPSEVADPPMQMLIDGGAK